MEFDARLFEGAGLTGILGAFMAVDESCNVPSFLVGQREWLAQRHVGLDEAGGRIDTRHARAPVVGVRAPERGKHHTAVGISLALAIRAMAQGAVLRVDCLS